MAGSGCLHSLVNGNTPLKGLVDVTEYLTIAEASDRLRTPEATLRYWRHMGKGPKSFKLGRRVLYEAADVEAFIAEAKRTA